MRTLQRAVANGQAELARSSASNHPVPSWLVVRVRLMNKAGRGRGEIQVLTGLAASTVSKIIRRVGRFA